MVVVDTHCHASLTWFEPVEILLDQMSRNDVDKAALIQIRGQYDNSYILECVRRFPGRFSAVVIVDHARVGAPQRLEEWTKQGAEGIRLTPTDRSPGRDPLAIWRKAAELGVPVSSGGSLEEFASAGFESIIKEFPTLKIIIEHLGGVGRNYLARTTNPSSLETYKRVLALAKYPNAYMKVPGLGEFCPRPQPLIQPMPFAEIPPLVEMAVAAFGPRRLMWGSDFPPVANREGYHNALRFPMQSVDFGGDANKEWVFGGTAATLWKFPS
ncbi:MAG: amidohydrolase [Dehalococcoidia bacterium]|nr:amidohydrolase [Dehalococcoidia bacterium]MSQ16535.1 amidohydrolase [Dehalococcoidia bacterium]